MENVLNYWGLYPWFNEEGEHMIHPDDIELLIRIKPYGKVFKCIAINDEYITIMYSDYKFRVKRELFNKVDSPLFTFEEKVMVKDKEICGIIAEINWHHGKNEIFYLIKVEGKKKSKRYFSCDLMKKDI